MQVDSPTKLPVTWLNVLVGLSILLVDVLVSYRLRLGIARDLIVAAVRCIVQLALLGLILGSVFEAQNVFAVMGMGLAMLLLGANEVTFTRSKKRTEGLVSARIATLGCPSSVFVRQVSSSYTALADVTTTTTRSSHPLSSLCSSPSPQSQS